MRDVLYKFNPRGIYETKDSTAFGKESQLKLILEPHEYSLQIGKEVLRSTSFTGCAIIVSNEGEVTFYDKDNNITFTAEKQDKVFKEIILQWNTENISIEFGHTEVVDYYPNCDGEYDRWGESWETEYKVKINTTTNMIENT